ncbi:MAG: class I SAM-dependent methyltransferase [Reichenbachiella sp.]
MMVQHLNNALGNIDLYLLDQILKGNIDPKSKILDLGCGEGRNLIYFLNNGFDVYGLDLNPDAIKMLHFIIKSKYNHYDTSRFEIGDTQNLPYSDHSFDYLICSAVLHFSKDKSTFWKSIDEISRILTPNGSLFIRMTSDIGLSGQVPTDTPHVFQLPDSSHRFLLDLDMIAQIKTQYSFEEIEPIKTVVVNNKRCMTTLVLRKLV